MVPRYLCYAKKKKRLTKGLALILVPVLSLNLLCIPGQVSFSLYFGCKMRRWLLVFPFCSTNHSLF